MLNVEKFGIGNQESGIGKKGLTEFQIWQTFPLPASRFPLPASRFPLPASRFPLPASRSQFTEFRQFIHYVAEIAGEFGVEMDLFSRSRMHEAQGLGMQALPTQGLKQVIEHGFA